MSAPLFPASLRSPMPRRSALRHLAAWCAAGPAVAWSRQQAEVETEPLRVPLAISENLHRPFPLKVLQLLGQGAHVEWDLQWMPFVRVLASAEQGKAMGFGLSRTPDREELLQFSDTLFSTNAWLVGRRDKTPDLGSVEELAGHTVCMARGMKVSPAFDQGANRDFGITHGADDRMRVRMLLGRRCDVAVVAHRSRRPEAVMQRLQVLGLPTAELRVLSSTPLVSMPVGLAVAKDSPLAPLMARINESIRRKTPDIRALIERDLG